MADVRTQKDFAEEGKGKGREYVAHFAVAFSPEELEALKERQVDREDEYPEATIERLVRDYLTSEFN